MNKPLFSNRASNEAAMEAMARHHTVTTHFWWWLGGGILVLAVILLLLGLRNPDMRRGKPIETADRDLSLPG